MEPGGPPGLGVRNLAAGAAGVLGNNTTQWVFPVGDVWKKLAASGTATVAQRNRMRESIARGHDVFMFRTFWIRDVQHLNTVGLGNPTKRTCSTCHGMHMTGHGRGQRLDGPRRDQPAVGARGAAQSLERAEAADAAVQAHVPGVGAAARVSRTRDLHAGSGPGARDREVHRRGRRS